MHCNCIVCACNLFVVNIDTTGKERKVCGNKDCTNVEQFDKKFPRCGRCRNMWYCSKECQVKDWKFHKKNCVPHDKK